MRKTIIVFLLVAALSLPLLAQSPAEEHKGGPPKVIQIQREEIKPGRTYAHEQNETAWAAAFASSKFPSHYLAMTSVTGPDEAWFITPYASFEAWEKANAASDKAPFRGISAKYGAAEADWVSHYSSIAAVYRPDLSYRPNINVAEYRYFTVNRIRVRPGRGREFEEARKLQVAMHEKANVDERLAVYEVVSGAPSGTYLYFVPAKSMKDADTYEERHKPYETALGSEGAKKISDAMANSLIGEEEAIFAFSPKLSYMEADFGKDDPFWHPHAMMAKAPAAKTGVQPAAMQTGEKAPPKK